MHKYLLPLLTTVALLVLIIGPNIVDAATVSNPAPVSTPDLRNKLLFLRNGDIWTYDVQNKTETPLTHSKHITNYAISADAAKIAYFRDHEKLYLYDVATGTEEYIIEEPTDASQPAFSPQGDKIAFTGYTKDKVEVRFNYYTKPIAQRVRHILIVDVRTKKTVDVTSDIAYQHSQVNWSPDGRWLSFASFRFGTLDLLNPFSNKNWQVYLMDLNDPKHKTSEISDGMSSVWLNNDQVVVSDGVVANVLSIYDVRTKTIKPASMFKAGFSSPIFSFGGINNEVVYYEVILDIEGNGLIRSYNIQTNKTEDVVKDASVPRYVK